MIYTIQLSNETHKTRRILDIFSCLYPFKNVSDGEKDILAEYIDGYLELITKVSKEDVFSTLFGYDFKAKISKKLSTKDKNLSMDAIANFLTKLRKKGLIHDRTIDENVIKLFEKIDNEITFVLKVKE